MYEKGSCYRCGRDSHFVKDCYAKTDVYGEQIEENAKKKKVAEKELIKAIRKVMKSYTGTRYY